MEGGRDDAEELVRLVSGLKVDAASLRGLEANLLTLEGVSLPEGGCDMVMMGMCYFRYMIRRSICIVVAVSYVDYEAMRSSLGMSTKQ